MCRGTREEGQPGAGAAVGKTVRGTGCEFHEAARQSLPSDFRHQGSGGAGGGGVRRVPCVFDGGRHHIGGTVHGADGMQKGEKSFCPAMCTGV